MALVSHTGSGAGIGAGIGAAAGSVLGPLGTLAGGGLGAILGAIIGGAQNDFTGVWSGGFAGIDAKNLDVIINALTKYVDNAQNTIQSFNENTTFEEALKGEVLTATKEYCAAVKQLFQAYITTMRVNISDAKTAFEAYTTSSNELAANISSDAESIRNEAAKIKLD